MLHAHVRRSAAAEAWRCIGGQLDVSVAHPLLSPLLDWVARRDRKHSESASFLVLLNMHEKFAHHA
ncbi:MAG TPA: hypothetical protein VN886_08650 [Acidimicrobiales bacterium]|nr:hypothetical protein [Acidimicrobiales bacterium]